MLRFERYFGEMFFIKLCCTFDNMNQNSRKAICISNWYENSFWNRVLSTWTKSARMLVNWKDSNVCTPHIMGNRYYERDLMIEDMQWFSSLWHQNAANKWEATLKLKCLRLINRNQMEVGNICISVCIL